MMKIQLILLEIYFSGFAKFKLFSGYFILQKSILQLLFLNSQMTSFGKCFLSATIFTNTHFFFALIAFVSSYHTPHFSIFFSHTKQESKSCQRNFFLFAIFCFEILWRCEDSFPLIIEKIHFILRMTLRKKI